MKYIFISVILYLSLSVCAQTTNWRFVDIKNNGYVVGHIYYTESIGRQSGARPDKVASGLRLVCSSKDFGDQDAGEPLLIIYWDGMYGNIPEKVSIKIDDRQIGVGQPYIWKHDGPTLYRTISESGEILRAMKIGRSMHVSWTTNNGIQRTTVFDLRTFTANIGNFNDVCNTRI